MALLAPEDREALQISPDAELVAVDRNETPARPAALGRGAPQAEYSLSHEKLLEALKREPLYTFYPLKAEGLFDRIARWDVDPRVSVLELLPEAGIGKTCLAGGGFWSGKSSIVLDCRARPAFARFMSKLYDILIHCDNGDVSLFEVKNANSGDEGTPPESWSPEPQPEVPIPNIRAFLGGHEAEAWLLETAERMAHASRPLSRIAAVGLIVRLWSPPSRKAREDVLEALRAGRDSPVDHACRWFQQLPSQIHANIERTAIHESGALEERLPELEQVALKDPELASKLGVSWLHRRDDLECVVVIMACAKAGASLREELTTLDSCAAQYQTLWQWFELEDDERLNAVSWKEPGAWWGQLLLSEQE